MGYYIQCPENNNKADYIVSSLGGITVSLKEAEKAVENSSVAVICVVENAFFEAAGFCFNKEEFNCFADPSDTRNKKWLIVHDRDLIKKLTNCNMD